MAAVPYAMKTMIPGCYVQHLEDGKIGALIVFNPEKYNGTCGYYKRIFDCERDACDFLLKYGDAKASPGNEEFVAEYVAKLKESERFSFNTLSTQ